MAYVSQELKKSLAPKIKEILNKYDMKGSISVDNHSTLVVTLKSGKLDFSNNKGVNHYHYMNQFEGKNLEFLSELIPVMNEGNHDRSDSMSDYYYDVGWYISIRIGKRNKPYILEN